MPSSASQEFQRASKAKSVKWWMKKRPCNLLGSTAKLEEVEDEDFKYVRIVRQRNKHGQNFREEMT